MEKCKNCGRKMNGHPNKKFCSNKGRGNCKDEYHNRVNPRGYDDDRDDVHLGDDDQSWDAHKDHGF